MEKKSETFRDPTERHEAVWRIRYKGFILSPSFNSKGAAEACLRLILQGVCKPEYGRRGAHPYVAPGYPKDGLCTTCGRRRDDPVHD